MSDGAGLTSHLPRTREIHDNIVAAYIRGFQGIDANMQGEKIVACAKHYIGDGGTTGGVDQGNTVCTEAVPEGHSPASLSEGHRRKRGDIYDFFQQLERDQMRSLHLAYHEPAQKRAWFRWFRRFRLGGYRKQFNRYKERHKRRRRYVDGAFELELIYHQSENPRQLISQVPQSRIDDAVRRILRIKFRAGLFEHPYTDRTLLSSFGSAEHRAVAREAVRKSLVLLKNIQRRFADCQKRGCICRRKQRQQLDKTMRRLDNRLAVNAQRKLDKRHHYSYRVFKILSTGSVTFSANGSGAAGHDVAIVVVGEGPYAEGNGDDSDLSLSSTDITTINTVRDSGTPYVIVLVSGRPMIITNQIADADAFVAAWLPGTEGQGVADVLFGDYGLQANFPSTWPSDMSQIPINIGDAAYAPLFPFGFGIGSPADFDGNGNVDLMI